MAYERWVGITAAQFLFLTFSFPQKYGFFIAQKIKI